MNFFGIKSTLILVMFFGVSAMKIPSVQKTSFEKILTSPNVPKDFKKGVLLNTPKEIYWGEELSLSGFLKDDLEDYPADSTNSTFGLIVEPMDNVKFKGRYETREVGQPEIRMSGDVFKIFKKNGELYFNIDGQHPYRPLPPGVYKMILNYRDFYSEPKLLKVKAGGWRLKFSEALVDEICKGQILKDLSTYLSMSYSLELVDIGPQGMGDYIKKMNQAWDDGFSKYKAKFGLLLPKDQNIDNSVDLYIQNQLHTKCTKADVRSGTVSYILRGISKSN